jgi:hypothetical protein
MTFGTAIQQSGGTTLYHLLEKDVKWLIQRLDKLVGKAIIVGNDDTIITAHPTSKIAHK